MAGHTKRTLKMACYHKAACLIILLERYHTYMGDDLSINQLINTKGKTSNVQGKSNVLMPYARLLIA
jgi:hypothetical protein